MGFAKEERSHSPTSRRNFLMLGWLPYISLLQPQSYMFVSKKVRKTFILKNTYNRLHVHFQLFEQHLEVIYHMKATLNASDKLLRYL